MALPNRSMLNALRATRLEPGVPAQAAVFSLPVPPDLEAVSVAVGHEALTIQSTPIAWWPERLAARTPCSVHPEGSPPRRVLVTLCSDTMLPETLRLSSTASSEHNTALASEPAWELVTLEKNYLTPINWEVNELIIRHGQREVGLRVGLMPTASDADDAARPMWWEWVRAEQLWAGPACQALRVAGYASAFRLTVDHPDYRDHKVCPWVHHQHWVLCEIYALLFANGVVHVTARHVNNHLYDNGQDVHDVTPIVGLRGDGSCAETQIPLVGEAVDVDLGGVRLCTDECRTFSSAEHPGSIRSDGTLAILQPYEGVEICLSGYGASWRRERQDGFVCRADENVIPAGVARSVRFCLSLSDAPARAERYTLPYHWYGLCAELAPQPLLPVSDVHDPVIDAAGTWLRESQITGHFIEGSIPRGASHYHQDGSLAESGWEGETPFNLIRYFYRHPSADTWRAVLRNAYYIADVAVDHASFMMRMHGYPFGAISITMNRGLGILQGYLETGDPYLLETVENMAMCSAAMDRSNWPRRSYGRDAMFIRALIALEDYVPGRGHAARAREALSRTLSCQRPDGSYSDQSGPGGVHGAGNMVIKPWMNFMVMEPMLDWLERCPDDAEVAATVKAICDWQLTTVVHEGDDCHFPYEHAWGDNPGAPGAEPGAANARHPFGRLPGAHYPARALLFASRFFNDPRYLETWDKVYQSLGGLDRDPAGRVPHTGDHAANKAVESLTWHQIQRWRATWQDGELALDPYALPGEDLHATIHTPDGPREVTG